MMQKEWYQVLGSNGTWFVLNKGWRSMRYWDLAWKLVKAWPGMVEAGRRNPGGVFAVSVNGNVTRLR